MPAEDLNLLQDDEDVIIEGSELHQALVNAGFTNFDSIPKVKMESNCTPENNVPSVNNTWSKSFNKLHCVHRYFFQKNSLRKNQLNIILSGNVLLDDHAVMVYEFFDDQSKCVLRKFVRWFPFIGSTAGLLSLAIIKKDIRSLIVAGAIFGSSIYIKAKSLLLTWNLQKLVQLQNDLHNSIKHALKILRRHCKKSIISTLHEKNESIGSEKYTIILEIKMILFEILENVSHSYYEQGNDILQVLPLTLHSKCLLTKIEVENNYQNGDDYTNLRSLYYAYILAQSETMFALANAYNGKAQDTYFEISHRKLQHVVHKLYGKLTIYNTKLHDILQIYKINEIQPVKRVFKGTPSSKWQDVYIHLDITSQRIQLAYKEITNILDLLDINRDDNDDDNLIESITEKMNEAYKQIENAKSFAEFSSLLIANAQRKAITTEETENENENLFSVDNDNRTVFIIDKEPEIEDEVFEEYIREEYLKPLIEGSEAGIINEYKLDKLLKKNFMSELKEALVDKQKSMTERELKALKRMYEKIKRDSSISKSDLDKINENESTTPTSAPPPPPAPPLPPPTLVNRVIAETEEPEENMETVKKNRGPVPLPRVKMLQTNDQMPYVQQFSISECTPNFKFPPFKAVEETFLGSGENSEEEEEENDKSVDSNDEGAEN